jgi:hypothetical protein
VRGLAHSRLGILRRTLILFSSATDKLFILARAGVIRFGAGILSSGSSIKSGYWAPFSQGLALYVMTIRERRANIAFPGLERLPFDTVPPDENSSTIKKATVPFFIGVRNKLAHSELTGMVIDILAFQLSINMTSTLQWTLRCRHDSSRLPSFDHHIGHPRALVTFKSPTRRATVLWFGVL